MLSLLSRSCCGSVTTSTLACHTKGPGSRRGGEARGIRLAGSIEEVVKGLTGSEGAFYSSQMIQDGTAVVDGLIPGKGAQELDLVPIFNIVRDAVRTTAATASVIFVPPGFPVGAIMEAAKSGINTIVCLTEGIPVLDMITERRYSQGRKVRLIGPETPGISSANECKIEAWQDTSSRRVEWESRRGMEP